MPIHRPYHPIIMTALKFLFPPRSPQSRFFTSLRLRHPLKSPQFGITTGSSPRYVTALLLRSSFRQGPLPPTLLTSSTASIPKYFSQCRYLLSLHKPLIDVESCTLTWLRQKSWYISNFYVVNPQIADY